MSSQEVCDYISERLNANYAKLSQICEELFMHCLAPNSEGDGTGCDNMTCIIVTFSPFRKAVCKIASPLGSLQSNSLKRTYENGKENNITNNNNGNGTNESTAANSNNHGSAESVGDGLEGGEQTAQKNANNDDETASNISKKLKQENDAGRELRDVIA